MRQMMKFGPRRGLLAGLALAGGLVALAGCAVPTPYAPRVEGQQAGYTDRELAPGRFRVTFTGNSVTPRDTVESYLLLRAAEVTLAAGGTAFEFDTRNTQAKTNYTAIPNGPGPYFGGPGFGGPGFGGPGWGRPWGSFWGGGFHRGFRGWGGFGYDPDVDIIARTKYEAYAEIVLLTPDQAAREPRAINAREVVNRLGPEAAASQAAQPAK